MSMIVNKPVPVGSPLVIPIAPAMRPPISVRAIPGSGGTIAVEYSLTDTALSNPAAANWAAWPSGTVGTATSDVITSPVVALRFTAATVAGSAEVVAS